MSSSGKGGKGRFTSRATVPGAVAVHTTDEPEATAGSARPAPPQPPESQAAIPGSRKAAPSEQSIVAAPPPPEEPEAAYAASTARPPSAQPQASLPVAGTGAPRSGKARRTTPAATTPGAVAVAASLTQEPASVSPTTMASDVSQPLPSGKARRTAPAATSPGAVAVATSLTQEPDRISPGTATNSSAVSKPLPSGKGVRRNPPATRPGAVPDVSEGALPPPSYGKNVLRTSAAAAGSGGGGVGGVVPGAMRVAVGARESSKEGAVTTGEMQIEQATVEMQQLQRTATTSSYEAPVTPGGRSNTQPVGTPVTPGAHSVASSSSQDAEAVYKDPKARHAQRGRNAAPVVGAAGAATTVVVVAANSAAANNTYSTNPALGIDDSNYLIKMENKVLEHERSLNSSSSRQILNQHPADVKSSFGTDPAAKSPFDLEQPSGGVVRPPDDTAAMVTTAARGMDVPPHLAYGTTGVRQAGYRGLSGDDGLAVAIAISEDEDEMFLPAAVEFDPDAKPPLLKNRRFRLYIISATLIFVVVIIVLILGLVVFGGGSNASSSNAPTVSPLTKTFDAEYTQQFAAILGRDVADFPFDSPQYRAMEWILEEDAMKLGSNDTSLLQRYLLAVFYFSTTNNGELSWRSCNPDRSDYNIVDCQYLNMNTLANDSIAYTPEPSYRWLSNVHECKWAGNLCDDNNITRAIDLLGQNITGTIPTELAALPLIQSIALAYNQFVGTLPVVFVLPEIARHLINIEVHGNYLTGSIPDEYYKATGLQNLNIGQNILTGTLSTEIGLLTNLKGLHTFNNQLSGTIPTEIGKLEYLTFTRHSNNRYNGTIPSEVGEIALMQEMWLDQNQFTGAIPSELGLLTDLMDIRFSWNKLSGSIPSEIYSLSLLFRLDLFSNHLTGSIQTEIGALTSLSELRVSRNQLTGKIPTEIGNLNLLQLAWLHINKFEGSVPLNTCNLTKLVYLQADCFPIGNAACPCECCTACCDRTTEICLVLDDNAP